MARRVGLQAEVLASLALVMTAATAVLAVVLVASNESVVRPLLARALAQEARSTAPVLRPVVPGTAWWIVAPKAPPRARGVAGPPDAETLALAEEARRVDATLLRRGGRGEPMRIAVPLGQGGRVVVGRLPAEASQRLERTPRRVALVVLLADAVVFTVFGFTVLRRRLVLPLRRLRDAAEAIARGEWGARVAVEGAGETADLAQSFNTMTEALEMRTEALEKAVADLRTANRDLRQARAGLDRAERMAAVGRLAAGVAHEVGNPMGAILAFLDLAGRDPQISDATRSHLGRAGREGQRVREILRQLLDFSRPARGVPASVDLESVAHEVAGLVRAQRRYAAVAIEVERDSEVGPAWADGGAVTQILLNLLINAADAVRGAAEPRVRIRVERATLDLRAGEAPEAALGRQGFDAVACRISDRGPGIAPEDHERIFDPFFTTKDPGEGTGLGLANALRLAEESGGRLDLVEAEPGWGACFLLRLPRAGVQGESRGRGHRIRST
jgi:signal transduction histidine kinase